MNTALPTITKLFAIRKQSLAIIPGLLICLVIAATAFTLNGVHELKQFSPSIIAVIIGIIIGNLIKLPPQTHAGTAFSSKVLVRVAVALLGIQISVNELLNFGAFHIAMTIFALVSSFIFIKTIGKLFGVDNKLAELIAAGTSICGAAAVLGVNTATNAEDEDVAYAIGMVTIFGTLSMLLYPFIGKLLNLGGAQFGIWSGISIHEVAQVVGAVSGKDAATIHIATITKLTRVLMLAPLVTLIQFRRGSYKNNAKMPIPLFVVAFIIFIIIANIFTIPANIKFEIGKLSSFFLTVALAGMGLHTKFSAIGKMGINPLLLALAGSLFISILGLALIEFIA